ncbi:MAG: efflux RND transporter periplasmic adaptor subunit [Acetobacteraceae bacterium]
MNKRIGGACVAVAAVLAAAAWQLGFPREAASAPAAAAPPAIPVTVQAAKAQDMPVILRGLGTVQPLNVVEIKAQVSGILTAIPVKEGQRVKKGDIVAEIDPRPFQATLDQAMAQRAGDQAQLKSAQLDLVRFQALAKREFAPVQQVDDQQATVDKLSASVLADNAAVETAQINLGYCVIRSPIDGRVSLYQTDAGNLIEVASQTGIISITQDQPIDVVFTLPEDNLPEIQDAMEKATLPVAAYSSDDRTLLGNGALTTPNNSIDTSTGTIQLKAVFPNERERLWPGEFVAAHLQLALLRNVVTVPLPAVQHGPGGLYVYTVTPNQTVAQQTIAVGYENGQTAVVTKGLKDGDAVVLTGQARLEPGVRVAVSTTSADAGSSPAATASASSAN